MNKLQEIKNQIFKLKAYYNTYNNPKYYDEINNIQNYLLNLKLDDNEKYIFFNLLFEYKINKYFNVLFNDLKYKYNLFSYNKSYDIYVHDYLYYKIYYNCEIYYDNIISIDDRIKKYQIKNFKKTKYIIDELLKINDFIDKTDFLNQIFNNKIIHLNNDDKFIYNEYNHTYEKLNINKKIQYPFPLTQYYDNNIINVYQCWIKSAINFFVNNGNFLQQFMIFDKGQNNKMEIINIDNDIKDNLILQDNNINYNILSDVIETESLKGGNNNDIYNLFQNMFIDMNKELNIENYYILIKRLLNEKLNNKYYLGIPGYKMYPFYVIQDILILLDDEFTNNCIIEYKNNNFKTYIYDCNINYFLDDLELFHDYQYSQNININDLDYNKLKTYKNKLNDYDETEHPLYNNKLSSIKFIIKDNKYYFDDNILNYIQNLKNTPNNLLIACPIHDLLGCYFLNNKNKFCKWDYDIIKYNIKFLYNLYDIRILYPYNIEYNKINYYLHSFIIVVNNDDVDSHFIYYKIDVMNKNKLNILNPDLLRFDTQKHRLNNNSINKLKDNHFIKIEYNNIYNIKGIFDNLNYKVVFCYYKKI